MGPRTSESEHLFLAMIHDRGAVPARVLAGMIDLEAVGAALADLMNSAAYKTSTTTIGWHPEYPVTAPPHHWVSFPVLFAGKDTQS
jgi:hypothetical protein